MDVRDLPNIAARLLREVKERLPAGLTTASWNPARNWNPFTWRQETGSGSGGGATAPPNLGGGGPDGAGPFSFERAFELEIDKLNARRRVLADALPDGSAEKRRMLKHRGPIQLIASTNPNAPGERIKLAPDHNLAALCLSGGGIRSASFCLGVVQAIDALTPQGQSDTIDRLDYLSTVSGGNYLGSSLAASLAQYDGSFPFTSKLDAAETPEIQHLRNYSKYLAPEGMRDYLLGALVVMRGLLANAIFVLPFLLLAALSFVAFHPNVAALGEPGFGFALWLAMGLAMLLVMVGWSLGKSATWALRRREAMGQWFVKAFLIFVVVGVVIAQRFVVAAMFNGPGTAATADAKGIFQPTLQWFANALPAITGVLAPFVVALVAFGQKLASIAKLALPEAAWKKLMARYGSRLLLTAAGLVVPVLLWICFLYLCYFGIKYAFPAPELPFQPLPALAGLSGLVLPDAWARQLGPMAMAYLSGAIILIFVALLMSPNANSLHGLYRDRLSKAFLFSRARLHGRQSDFDADRLRFSELLTIPPNAAQARKFHGPLLLVNTTLNLQGLPYVRMRGRDADFFTISPVAIGSESTWYAATADFESKTKATSHLTVASGMAISGAAASANMGSKRVGLLSLSLALLNVRLGYWLDNPGTIHQTRRRNWLARRGLLAFGRELFSRLNANHRLVHLSDGGHIDNLGLYEMLKRRCRVIIVVDAEADPELRFNSFSELQKLARIDLGARIYVPWRAIGETAAGNNKPTGGGAGNAVDKPARNGPHVAVGRIVYDEAPASAKGGSRGQPDSGVIIYIKSSLSGDENDMIRAYRGKSGDFPHETTVDQFFNEEQFEVYRALGFHAADRFFKGEDRFALYDPGKKELPGFIKNVESAMFDILAIPRVRFDKAILAAR